MPTFSQRPTLIFAVTLIASIYSSQGWAGPDWRAIENARKAKKQENQQIKETQTRQQTGLEKLEAACDKAKKDKKLSEVCDEIISAYKELN